MTRRHDRTLAALIATALTLACLSFLAWCQHRGFDDSMCRAYQACGWRDADRLSLLSLLTEARA